MEIRYTDNSFERLGWKTREGGKGVCMEKFCFVLHGRDILNIAKLLGGSHCCFMSYHGVYSRRESNSQSSLGECDGQLYM